jgi:uncharacterized protein (TIGR02679 family)
MTEHAWRTWLDQPALARFWDRLRDRLERNGLQVRGRLRLDDVTDAERQAIGLLMGRAVTGDTVSVQLSEVDIRLGTGAAARGLVEVVAELRGPLTDRPALKQTRLASSTALWNTAREALRDHGLDATTWAGPWLEEIRRSGTPGRLDPVHAAGLITQAIGVLATLCPPGPETVDRQPLSRGKPAGWGGPVGRGELAERFTGTAHGLDDDTLLSRLVLRALARVHGIEPPGDARARRELWEAAGVATDRVSSTVLTYGLTPLGDEPAERLLRERTLAGFESHLTLRDLRRMTWRLPVGTEVFVCENPRIVEAAADHGCVRPLACVSGNPTTVALTLLDALRAAGARLAYRGDFDWPGIAIANRLIGRYEARPWRMGARDYEAHVATARERGTPLQPLTGPPVEAVWDTELAPAMVELDAAVQEESALDLLLADLR